MAQLDWYNENANRAYPFKENNTATLCNNEIIDCGFYIYNNKDKDVWLASKDSTENSVSYTFTYTNCPEPLTFTAELTPNNDEWQTVWNENDNWKGFCVIGTNDRI